jgi:uncharacterized protein YcbK (DUF882 family)
MKCPASTIPEYLVKMRNADSAQLSRRSFCALGALAAASALVPKPVMAAATAGNRELSFFNTHTGETLTSLYCCAERYEPVALAKINHILRDHRANEAKEIDVHLLDLLHKLGGTLQTSKPYHVISGYRSPSTNATLRTQGGAHTGVASKSLHMVGKAIDIRVPDVPLKELRSAAVSLKAGGVGYYPDLNFVHVDVGRVRYW